MLTEDFREILFEKDDETGIVKITLNIPKRKNALSHLTFLELFWAVDIMENDDSATAMIITGAKDPDNNDPAKEAFSSGGYFNMSALDGVEDDLKRQMDFQDIAQKKLTMKFWQFDKPVIAAINGLAIGAGFTMPLAGADLIYMSEHAWLKLPFISLGIVPEFASTYLLPRLVGFQKAKEVMFFGESITANEALELGLVNKVVKHEELLPCAKEAALKLVPPQGAGLAVRLTKRALHKTLIDNFSDALDLENEGLNKAVTTSDFLEYLTARGQKRAPVFKGE
jgi:enoyl-CoA hydratase/carnithine racemase